MKVILAAMMSLHIVSNQKRRYFKHVLHFKYLLNLKHLLDDTLSERLVLMLTEDHRKIPIFLERSGLLMRYANNNNPSILKSFFAWYLN